MHPADSSSIIGSDDTHPPDLTSGVAKPLYLLSDLILPSFLLVFAFFTVLYWFGIILRLPQAIIWLGFLCGCGAGRKIFFKNWQQARLSSATSWTVPVALIFAMFCVVLFATNPDDSTFFHRVAHTLHPLSPLPVDDTRFAFDELPAISSAHLASSWEYALALIGAPLGSPLFGYQVIGSFLASIIFVAAVEQVSRKLFPKAGGLATGIIVLLTLLLMVYDADLNRRIGAWLILGGWTGKCFLSALFVLLFANWFSFAKSGSRRDTLLLVATVISMIGLTGSAFFILPIGLGSAWLTSLLFFRGKMPWFTGAVIVALPVVIGAVFLIRFGATHDISYWDHAGSLGPVEYVTITHSYRNLVLMALVALIAILAGRITGKQSPFLMAFLAFQGFLILVLFTPFPRSVFFHFVPPDGFWRAHYLIQYPVLYTVLCGWLVMSISQKKVWISAGLGAGYLGFLLSGQSVLQLQSQWGYQQHFQTPGTFKVDPAARKSITAAAPACAPLRHGGILLAPEVWEVTAQLMYPETRSVGARHMQHNFNNWNGSRTPVLTREERNAAVSFVSNLTEDQNPIMKPIELGVTVVVSARPEDPVFERTLNAHGFELATASETYRVYCRSSQSEALSP